MSCTAFFARIRGRVQGVGFRYSCLNRAGTLGLLGWGRNTEDGGVEVWFEGDSEKQDTFLQWLYAGPPFASVGAVEWTTPTFWRVRKFFYKITKQIPC